MKFVFMNDTGQNIGIHPGTEHHGVRCDKTSIKPGEQVEFWLPDGTYPWVKMWDHGRNGLWILVSTERLSGGEYSNEEMSQ